MFICPSMQQPSNNGPSIEFSPGALQTRRDSHLARRTTWSPPARADSVEIKPLSQRWRFPPDARYIKCTPGALDGLCQATVEHNVTEGFILEDSVGFHWTANGRYLLFKEAASILKTEDAAQTEQSHLKDLSPPIDVHKLFSKPEVPMSESTSTSLTHAHQQHMTSTPALPEPHPQTRSTHRKSILKPLSHSTHSLNPIAPKDFSYKPLPYPWKVPTNALYKGAYPHATTDLTPETLELRVTSGYLIVDATGVRDAHTSTYRLLYVGQRDEREFMYTKTIMPYKSQITDSSNKATDELFEFERTPTPIVKRQDDETPVKGGVRFDARSLGLDDVGVVREDEVVDNEGKSWGMRRRRARARRSRGLVVSERGQGSDDGDGGKC